MNRDSNTSVARSIGRALLVSKDAATNEQLVAIFKEFAVLPETCSELPRALDLLNQKKFVAIVVDLLVGDESVGLLDRVRVTRSNQTTIVFAIALEHRSVEPLFKAGAHFVVRRPLSLESIRSTLQAAYGLMVREHRRYFRCPLTVPIVVKSSGKKSGIRCRVLNISEGGLAITTVETFKATDRVDIRFSLPGQSSQFTTECEICWVDGRGRVGLRFVALSTEQRCVLQEWLADRIEESLPLSVTDKFRADQYEEPAHRPDEATTNDRAISKRPYSPPKFRILQPAQAEAEFLAKGIPGEEESEKLREAFTKLTRRRPLD